VKGEIRRPGARHLTPAAVFLVLTGLLLLVLSPPCPHPADIAGNAQPVTSSVAGPLDDAGTHASCTAVSSLRGATTRTADCSRPDDGGGPPSDPPSTEERAAEGLPRPVAVVGEMDQPHGRSLLVLLGIERK
jgi:hypothetical protein